MLSVIELLLEHWRGCKAARQAISTPANPRRRVVALAAVLSFMSLAFAGIESLTFLLWFRLLFREELGTR